MRNTTTNRSTTPVKTTKPTVAKSIEKKLATTKVDTSKKKISIPQAHDLQTVKIATIEQKKAMTAEAAYYLSEKSGFNPTMTMDCWLEAERQIEESIQNL